MQLVTVELVMKRLSQQGMVLVMLVFILILATTGYMLKSLDSVGIKNERDKKTASALAQAKTALLAFAATQNLNLGGCSTNCPRPGDLPCPDANNDGNAETSCGNASGTSGQASRLGRLPWRTLGLPDLRDGDGERLWYAVSNPYKNNTRFRPLNSDTLGTITLRDSNGNIIFNGTNNGLVAVIISPGANLIRQDAISQVRDGANQNIPSNYLDIALGEDNQNFVDGGTNGFIMGPVKDATGRTIVNDQVLTVTRSEMNQAIEPLVLAEVRNSLSSYYSGVGALSFPRPAGFNDLNCLGNANISSPNCAEGAVALTHGRIPANPTAAWGATSILRGTSNNNWFQLNAWREVIHYAVAPACVTGTTSCGGVGFLTLNNALVVPTNNKRLVLIASGSGLGGQVRATNANKSNEVNYLEGENLAPLDDVYVRTMPLTALINDRAISLP